MITIITLLCYFIQLLLIKEEGFTKSPFHVKFKFELLEGIGETVAQFYIRGLHNMESTSCNNDFD